MMRYLNILNKIAQILSLLAVPILVAYFTYYIQKESSKAKVDQEYIKIAVNILKNPSSEVDPAVLEWAKKTFSSGSPIPLKNDAVELVFGAKVVKLKPPIIKICDRYSIKECNPKTNGELYECTLTIQKNLNLCADQVDAQIKWQDGQR